MTSPKKTLNLQDMQDAILGAHFYACGGGGALVNGEDLLRAVSSYFPDEQSVCIEYLDIQDVKDTDTLPVLAAMGSPQKFLEKGYSKSPITAFEQLEEATQTRFTTLSPVETGPVAYGMSLLVAAAKNIPIINGDGGGRAFPCLQLSTFANVDLDHPISVSPAMLTSEKSLSEDGGVIRIDCQSSTDVDAMTRGIISTSESFDHRASLASFPMTGRQLKQENAVVADMLMKSIELGRDIRQLVNDKLSCFSAIEKLAGSQLVMKGRLTNVETKTVGGFDWVTLEYKEEKTNRKFTAISKNENMLVWADDMTTPVAMAPDLICCISSDATLMSNDEVIDAWEDDPESETLKNMAIFVLPASKEIDQPWFHKNFIEILQKLGYHGSYHTPIPMAKEK
ncbi:DUF917 domain-containing protein [Enterovibrio coralii]|uniref:DUF917 domain-containing protein n=1 Tax=Enterovibrio coralii TaxID=294935 RepID=A0A135ICN9_9GAMM|nr:DUF917 domain-containing protein [Enterovibrio coralii]KXF83237.1 hypothetical protein ATN88_05990 [Enterovibrio coralii]